MAQFFLYQNTGDSRETYPFFVDVQNKLLDCLNTRLVIPLTQADRLAEKSPTHACPVFHIDEGCFVLLTHQMTSVPRSILTEPVQSLEAFRSEIIAAIDFLITGV